MNWLQRGLKGHSSVKEILHAIMEMVVTWLCPFIKTHHT